MYYILVLTHVSTLHTEKRILHFLGPNARPQINYFKESNPSYNIEPSLFDSKCMAKLLFSFSCTSLRVKNDLSYFSTKWLNSIRITV